MGANCYNKDVTKKQLQRDAEDKMSKIDTLLDKLCKRPTPSDFRFSDLRKVMAYFGYLESNKGATSGSRVKFYNPDTTAVLLLHKPHPGDEMPKAAVDSVVNFLKEHGHI